MSGAKEMVGDGRLIEGEDPLNKVDEADERLASLMAAIDGAGSYDEKRELWLEAIDDSQFEKDMRTMFGAIAESRTPDNGAAS